VIALALFALWMCVTSLVPINPGSGYYMWSKVMKIILMVFVCMAVIHERKQIDWVVWIIVASLGFFGLKGGIFTISYGGNFLVWGPAGSFIEGNNELALALVLAIPLMRYVQLQLTKSWQRWGMVALMGFSAVSAIGSHSRGALVAIAAMGVFLWLKSRNKFGMGLALGALAIATIAFMPAEWMERMHTIKSYEEDGSAQGRINAWYMAFNLAKANFFGGGFEIYDANIFGRYAPNPIDIHAAHSIYFQVLGEHGFVGLFLYLSIGALTWVAAGETKRKARGLPEFAWAGVLMDMVKVSMVGFAVGGAFLSLAYFDVPYYMTALVVATRQLVLAAVKKKTLEAEGSQRRRDAFGGLEGAAPALEPASDPAPGTARRPNWRGHEGFARGPVAKVPTRLP
jgi:putative inorganic carbon (hco3(-)) transporter